MSRSIGDSVAASVGVTSNPDYISLWLTEEDKFVILASDGIWEFITDQEAVQIVGETYKYQGPEASCSRLVEIAQKRWAMKDLNVDDITVIVAYLQVMD